MARVNTATMAKATWYTNTQLLKHSTFETPRLSVSNSTTHNPALTNLIMCFLVTPEYASTSGVSQTLI